MHTDTKVFRIGTHRCRNPDVTWEILSPSLKNFGVTRLADVTGLDRLRIPVFVAVRPMSRSLCVSQGKGLTPLLARVSAVMESIELWHAEQLPPGKVCSDIPCMDLNLPYDVSSLQMYPGSLLNGRTRFDWIEGIGLRSNQSVLVPIEAVRLDWEARQPWDVRSIQCTSNGLASGNSYGEAVVHALYELLERDIRSNLSRLTVDNRTHIDPASIDDARCANLVDLLMYSNTWLEIVAIGNDFNIACFVAYLWSEDFPAIAAGCGAHSDPAVALSRAITEAAQSRVTAISGARDDVDVNSLRLDAIGCSKPVTKGAVIQWKDVTGKFENRFDRFSEEAAWLGTIIENRTGMEPLIVNLSSCVEFAVVKVIAPGLRYQARHGIPRPTEIKRFGDNISTESSANPAF